MNNIKKNNGSKGFTLIEILVVIGIIAVLATIVLIAINPARQFAQARNSQRTSNVNAILNAVGQRMVDNQGEFDTLDCGGVALPTVAKNMDNDTGYDIRPCLVNRYMPELPADPRIGSNTCVDTVGYPANCPAPGAYDLRYTIVQDDTTKRITVCAPDSALETAIQPGPELICVTR